MSDKGRIIVIDGLDGSGKNTQVKMAYNELVGKFENVKMLSFPDYKGRSSELVKMYLNGEICENAEEVNPYGAAILYSADRYISYKREWERFSKEGILLLDRYFTANIIHQGSKLENKDERVEFYKWANTFEVDKLGIPREDKVIILLVKPEVSRELIIERADAEHKNDIHENNMKYLEKCYNTALEAGEILNWDIIDCVEQGTLNMRSKDSIHKDVMKIVNNCL